MSEFILSIVGLTVGMFGLVFGMIVAEFGFKEAIRRFRIVLFKEVQGNE